MEQAPNIKPGYTSEVTLLLGCSPVDLDVWQVLAEGLGAVWHEHHGVRTAE
jgi:hypothetical protein